MSHKHTGCDRGGNRSSPETCDCTSHLGARAHSKPDTRIFLLLPVDNLRHAAPISSPPRALIQTIRGSTLPSACLIRCNHSELGASRQLEPRADEAHEDWLKQSVTNTLLKAADSHPHDSKFGIALYQHTTQNNENLWADARRRPKSKRADNEGNILWCVNCVFALEPQGDTAAEFSTSSTEWPWQDVSITDNLLSFHNLWNDDYAECCWYLHLRQTEIDHMVMGCTVQAALAWICCFIVHFI